MSFQEGFQHLSSPSPEEVEEFPRDHESSADTLYPESCYPGGAGDVVLSTTLFTILYEEEELRELHYWNRESTSGSESPFEENGASIRPTIYYVLRLLDSIRGFHQVSPYYSYHDSAYLIPILRVILTCQVVILR